MDLEEWETLLKQNGEELAFINIEHRATREARAWQETQGDVSITLA